MVDFLNSDAASIMSVVLSLLQHSSCPVNEFLFRLYIIVQGGVAVVLFMFALLAVNRFRRIETPTIELIEGPLMFYFFPGN